MQLQNNFDINYCLNLCLTIALLCMKCDNFIKIF